MDFLPADLLRLIFDLCSSTSILAASCVCKWWNKWARKVARARRILFSYDSERRIQKGQFTGHELFGMSHKKKFSHSHLGVIPEHPDFVAVFESAFAHPQLFSLLISVTLWNRGSKVLFVESGERPTEQLDHWKEISPQKKYFDAITVWSPDLWYLPPKLGISDKLNRRAAVVSNIEISVYEIPLEVGIPPRLISTMKKLPLWRVSALFGNQLFMFNYEQNLVRVLNFLDDTHLDFDLKKTLADCKTKHINGEITADSRQAFVCGEVTVGINLRTRNIWINHWPSSYIALEETKIAVAHENYPDFFISIRTRDNFNVLYRFPLDYRMHVNSTVNLHFIREGLAVEVPNERNDSSYFWNPQSFVLDLSGASKAVKVLVVPPEGNDIITEKHAQSSKIFDLIPCDPHDDSLFCKPIFLTDNERLLCYFAVPGKSKSRSRTKDLNFFFELFKPSFSEQVQTYFKRTGSLYNRIYSPVGLTFQQIQVFGTMVLCVETRADSKQRWTPHSMSRDSLLRYFPVPALKKRLELMPSIKTSAKPTENSSGARSTKLKKQNLKS